MQIEQSIPRSFAIDQSACVMRSYSPCPEKVMSVIFSALLREDCVGYFEAYLTFICLNWFSFWLFFFVLFIHSVSDLLLCHADYSVLLFTLILLFLFCHFDFLSSRFHNLVLTHHFIFHKWWQKITNVKIEKF